jgi:predicted phosphodiesterase
MNTYAQKNTLKFENGKFKIVQFTDLHWIEDDNHALVNDSTLKLMKFVVNSEKPDLLVLTGDIAISKNAAKAWSKILQSLEECKVPFVVTFGNHDSEAGLTNKQILKILQLNPYNLTFNDVDSISGVGNCAIPVMSSDGKSKKWVLYFFDSHTRNSEKDRQLRGYDWIKFDQIQWYRGKSSSYTRANNNTPLPSLCFLHIPLPEFESVRTLKTTVGSTYEQVSCPKLNSGLFASFLEMKDVIGVFAGHDHNDDYISSMANICLAFGRKTGYNPGYKEVLERGARVIELSENEKKIATYILTFSGKLYEYSFEYK